MSKNNESQNTFIDIVIKAKGNVSVYLVNGIKLQGVIGAHDDSTLVLDNNIKQLVYKHSISTIVPAQNH